MRRVENPVIELDLKPAGGGAPAPGRRGNDARISENPMKQGLYDVQNRIRPNAIKGLAAIVPDAATGAVSMPPRAWHPCPSTDAGDNNHTQARSGEFSVVTSVTTSPLAEPKPPDASP